MGRGGVIVPPPEFLSELAALCRAHGVLLIVDEIMTGLGRTGALFAHTRSNVQPDLVCLGKALGGGLPISACIGREDVMRAWGDPDREALHTGTFFGQPLACAAALATLDVLEREGLYARAYERGESLRAQLEALLTASLSFKRCARGALVGLDLGARRRAAPDARAARARLHPVPAGAARDALAHAALCITDAQLRGCRRARSRPQALR